MLPFLAYTIHRLETNARQFFRLAHIWKFQRDADVSTDVKEYEERATIPPYVQEYIRNIQRKELT